jgi:HAD superfamily hydrolase (TIGR01509 family)
MASNHRLRAVVFDLDGLMFNTEDLYDEVGEAILRRRGRRFTDELKRLMMGRPGWISLQIMIDHHRLEATVAELQAESDALFAEILPRRLQPMSGLENLLEALEDAAIPKAIATSSSRAFARTVLAQFAYEPRFQFVLTSEDVTEGKPAPEVYLTACRRFGLAAEQVLVLEDSENGCRAAVAAGAFAVAVPGRHSVDHDFRGVAMVADSLADPRIYQALGLATHRTPG